MDSQETLLDAARRCKSCMHYFITHEVKFPYGCRALDFKSKRQPILEVIEASGKGCLYFHKKGEGFCR